MNFGHLLSLVDAERAWATGDGWAAAQAFDEAIRQLESRTRPWAQALITERAGLLHLERGLEHTGRALLAEARGHYARWGATGKVRELDRQYPYLRALPERAAGGPGGATLRGSSSGPSHHGTVVVTADDIDLVGVLRASAALSSETNADRLRDRVVDVLTLMTGATGVHLALWDDTSKDWFLRTGDGAERLTAGEAAARGLLPLSAFRYAERTWQPLAVEDATRDDRFARDPALAGLDSCSLLVVPVQGQGATRAILLLENRVHRGAFSADRLDAVLLIAGQLAVCLERTLAERFRSLVQRSSELTLVCDAAGIISYASSASAELLGVPEAALLGHPVTTLVQPGERDALAAWLGPAAGTRTDGRDAPEPGDALVCRLADGDREPRWAELTLTDLSADPAVGGLMLRLRDVTERRRLEAELRHAQKLESVGQLASGIAHEINTPIQFIDSNVRFLTDAFADLAGLLRATPDTAPSAASASSAASAASVVDIDDLLEEIPLALRDTLEGAIRVASIVRAMKAFGHPGGDSKSYADLNEAVRNTLVVAGGEIRPVADVVADLDDVPPVWCNLGDINQVLLNLVVNAAHAMAAQQATGGGRGTLTVRTRQDGDDILLEVSDTGTGIPPEIADRVFDQFFTTKEVGKGTGQGLALAHALIHERHAGSITFEPAPGTGTTFRVRLPNPPR
jgi:PAS domain S-box-containing protein